MSRGPVVYATCLTHGRTTARAKDVAVVADPVMDTTTAHIPADCGCAIDVPICDHLAHELIAAGSQLALPERT